MRQARKIQFRVYTIQGRLLVAFVTTVLVLGILSGAGSAIVAANHGRQQVADQLVSAAVLKQAEIETWMETLQFELEREMLHDGTLTLIHSVLVARSISARPNSFYRQLRGRLQEAAQLSPSFQELFLMDQRGVILLSSDGAVAGSFDGRQPYFRAGLQAPGIHVQTLSFSGAADKLNTVVVVRPIRNGSGAALGVLAGRASLDKLNRIMGEHAGLGETGETYLVGANRLLLTASRFAGYEVGQSFLQSAGISSALDEQAVGVGLYRGYRGVPVVGAYRWLPQLQAALLAEQEQQEAFGSLRATVRTSVGVTLLSMVAAVLLALLITRNLTQPIRLLAQTATQIAAGNWSQPVQIQRRDEIGELARAFDSMTGQLRGLIDSLEQRVAVRTHHLQAVASLSERLNVVLEPDAVLGELTRRTHEALDCDFVCVFVVDEPGERLVIREPAGRAGIEIEEGGFCIPLAAATSPVAEAARTGQIVHVDDVQALPAWLSHPLLAGTRSQVAVPIVIEARVVGVLDVHEGQAHAFDAVEIDTLRSLAGQAAVAFHNARLYSEMEQLVTQRTADLVVANAEVARRAERLAVVNRIGRGVGAILDLGELMEIVYQEIQAIFQMDAFFIALYDAAANEMDFRMLVDQGVRALPARHALSEGLTSLVVSQKRPLLVQDMEREKDHLPLPGLWGTMTHAASWLGVPMLIGERLIGILSVQSYAPKAYDQADQLLLSTIADQVAVAVEGARLYEAAQLELAERKRLEEQLVQAQKMEAIGRLAGGVAHDFNNLLTAIIGYSELLLENRPAADADYADLQEIKKAADRAASLTGQLLAFSRKQILQPRVLNLNTIITEMQGMLRRLIGENIQLVTELDPQLGLVEADLGQIEQVVMNLAVNARDAMPQGGQLTIRTGSVDAESEDAWEPVDICPGRCALLTVEDTGVGMDREVLARLFEPFFTTKARGQGTGLGLATVHGIVKQSGGDIHVRSEPGRGTVFRIYLPQLPQAPLLDAESDRQDAPRGAESVLLVEDEEIVRDLAQRALERQGYRVLVADHPARALQLCAQHSAAIHILVTDVVMPGMSGKELAQRLALQRPAMKVLYISGYTDNEIVHHGVLDAGVAFLQKPFTPTTLARRVRQILDDGPA